MLGPRIGWMVIWSGLLVFPGAELRAENAEDQGIRDRLTEREDENRLEDPWTIQIFGNPLSVSGEFETALEATDPILAGDPPDDDERLLWETEIEAELFYSVGERLSFFAQARFGMDWDALAETRRGVSDFFLERGEMWVYIGELFGTPLSIEIGRLDFEDDRLWWWDEELDAILIEWEVEPFGISLALARELGRIRTDEHFSDPEEDDRFRILAELSWELAEEHSLEFFVHFEDDRSGQRRLGTLLREEREDESDAQLLWLGPRAIGGFELGEGGVLGYWFDAAYVFGDETLVGYEELGRGRSVVEEVTERRVRGWGVDLGLTWFAPGAWEPRFTLGYAFGSGEGSSETGDDRSFRQTGLHGNEMGFGGRQRFGSYGRLLEPELSNLGVLTVGTGISLFESSSADLVYHYYHLADQAETLRDARLETAFDGRHRDVGHAVDLVLAIEEGDRVEFEFSLSAFRSGSAWLDHGEWAFGGFAAFRYAF